MSTDKEKVRALIARSENDVIIRKGLWLAFQEALQGGLTVDIIAERLDVSAETIERLCERN